VRLIPASLRAGKTIEGKYEITLLEGSSNTRLTCLRNNLLITAPHGFYSVTSLSRFWPNAAPESVEASAKESNRKQVFSRSHEPKDWTQKTCGDIGAEVYLLGLGATRVIVATSERDSSGDGLMDRENAADRSGVEIYVRFMVQSPSIPNGRVWERIGLLNLNIMEQDPVLGVLRHRNWERK
jgi:hypothetical protein